MPVDEGHVTEGSHGLGLALQRPHLQGEAFRRPSVVVVEEGEIPAAAPGDADVAGHTHPGVGLVDDDRLGIRRHAASTAPGSGVPSSTTISSQSVKVWRPATPGWRPGRGRSGLVARITLTCGTSLTARDDTAERDRPAR